MSDSTTDDDGIFDDAVCSGGYSEHDWELFDDRDGIRIYHCRRCGAESDPEEGDD